MNTLQKQAWLTVALATASFLTFGALCPVTGPYSAIGGFGLFGLSGMGPLFWKKQPLDERDRAIARRAALTAGMVSYSIFVLACMGAWGFVYQLRGSENVSIHILAVITGAGGFAFFVAQAVATLALYRGRSEADCG